MFFIFGGLQRFTIFFRKIHYERFVKREGKGIIFIMLIDQGQMHPGG
jgi:hypothetical protein